MNAETSSCSSSASASAMSPTFNHSAKTRNAQAQALLRARRKAYISELETSNADLSHRCEDLQSERDQFSERLKQLEAESAIFKESFKGSLDGRGHAQIEDLVATVEVERQRVRKLRSAIRSLIAVDENISTETHFGQDKSIFSSAIAQSTGRKRTRTSLSSSTASPMSNVPPTPPSSSPLPDPSVTSTITTSTANTLTTTPLNDQVPSSTTGMFCGDKAAHQSSPPVKLSVSMPDCFTFPMQSSDASPPSSENFLSLLSPMESDRDKEEEEEEEASRSVLSLLLAQPANFKRDVVYMLAQELATSRQQLPSSKHSTNKLQHPLLTRREGGGGHWSRSPSSQRSNYRDAAPLQASNYQPKPDYSNSINSNEAHCNPDPFEVLLSQIMESSSSSQKLMNHPVHPNFGAVGSNLSIPREASHFYSASIFLLWII